MGEGKVFRRGRGRRTSAGAGATKTAREGRLVEKVVALVMAGLGPPLLNCAVKNSRTRCAAFGVGVNSEAGCSSGARERMISVVMAWLLAARRPAGSTAPETAITAGAGKLSRGRSRRDKREPGPVRKIAGTDPRRCRRGAEV